MKMRSGRRANNELCIIAAALLLLLTKQDSSHHLTYSGYSSALYLYYTNAQPFRITSKQPTQIKLLRRRPAF